MAGEIRLTNQDRSFYEWQLAVPGMGEEGQSKLRNTTALVTRLGGLGGPIAFSLAAAGVGVGVCRVGVRGCRRGGTGRPGGGGRGAW